MTAAEAPLCAPPDSETRKPSFEMPAMACDSHAHICDPAGRPGLIPERIYTPCDATLPDYRRMLDALGVPRGVIVQPSFYGADNTVLLNTLREGGGAYRGVAVVREDVSQAELKELDEAGVRGLRFNIVDVRDGKGVLPVERIAALARKIAPLGWHVEMLMHVDEFPDMDRQFADLPTDIVVGHLGYVATRHGTQAPGFQALLRLMETGKAWVKLTGPYRISPHDVPYADTDPFATALVAANPDRLVWGTDWPHVKVKWDTPMPNDGDIADVLARWVPDAAIRKRILVDNPAQLYGF